MVVVLGFGFVHGGEREGRKRDINEREREREREREILMFLMCYIGI